LIRLYRVLRKKYANHPFDGEGAYLYGGRWSSPGTRLSYTSEHQSLAMLEYFVHLDQNDPPADLVLAVAEASDEISKENTKATDLPKNWRNPVAPSDLASIGDSFAERADNCLLFVPSVIAPGENNCLINPQHSDFKTIRIAPVQALTYDLRMFGKHHGRSSKR
jgi:RES domain-containing protein